MEMASTTGYSLPPGRTCTRCGIELDERTCAGGARGAPVSTPAGTRPGVPRTRCDDCSTNQGGARRAGTGNPLAVPRDFLAREAWMEEAACATENPDVFYPGRGESPGPARLICAGCDVADLCLAYALRHTIRHGIWGGTSERERRKMRAGIIAKERDAKKAEAAALPPSPPAPPPTCPICGATPPPPGPQGGRRRVYCGDECKAVAAAARRAA